LNKSQSESKKSKSDLFCDGETCSSVSDIVKSVIGRLPQVAAGSSSVESALAIMCQLTETLNENKFCFTQQQNQSHYNITILSYKLVNQTYSIFTLT